MQSLKRPFFSTYRKNVFIFRKISLSLCVKDQKFLSSTLPSSLPHTWSPCQITFQPFSDCISKEGNSPGSLVGSFPCCCMRTNFLLKFNLNPRLQRQVNFWWNKQSLLSTLEVSRKTNICTETHICLFGACKVLACFNNYSDYISIIPSPDSFNRQADNRTTIMKDCP